VPRDDGSAQRIYRCPDCQVAVFSGDGQVEVWYVRAGTLDQPSSVSPDAHIYTRSKLPWIELPGSTPAFDAAYDRAKVWPTPSNERLEALVAQRSMATKLDA
jgi:hypothetical protein